MVSGCQRIRRTTRFESFFQKATLHELLDSITHIHDTFRVAQYQRMWREFVEQAFREENVAYAIDEEGGVHPYVDEEFERNKRSTLAVLESPHLAGVRAAIDDAFRHCDGPTPDTKAAIRSIFEAVEIAAKLIVPSASRLNRSVCKDALPKACLATFAGQPTERKVIVQMFESLGYWVDAFHNFRHGQIDTVPTRPSDELTIYALSTGCAHLRWLAPHVPS